MSADVLPFLTVAARRRTLIQLASDYNAERGSSDRPYTEAMPVLLDGLRAHHVPLSEALELFEDFAREQAIGGKAGVAYDEIEASEERAEILLSRIVGESA